jgi:transcriptional regulator with XRE-family HTH domain
MRFAAITIREKLGLTAAAVAKELGWASNRVSRYETSERGLKEPDLKKLAAFYNISTAELLGEAEPVPTLPLAGSVPSAKAAGWLSLHEPVRELGPPQKERRVPFPWAAAHHAAYEVADHTMETLATKGAVVVIDTSCIEAGRLHGLPVVVEHDGEHLLRVLNTKTQPPCLMTLSPDAIAGVKAITVSAATKIFGKVIAVLPPL